jgi:hypothetical protein
MEVKRKATDMNSFNTEMWKRKASGWEPSDLVLTDLLQIEL